jgi:FixJ family two-component response regulator
LIADVNMPGMSGVDLYCLLGASGQRIPPILITSYPSERVRARALSDRTVGYLTRPFGEDALFGSIRSALARGR